MRILQIVPQLPYPPDTGGRTANFHVLKYLSRRHTMTLVSFVTPESEPHVPALAPYCDRIVTVPHRAEYVKRDMLLNLFSSTPYTMAKFRLETMWETIREIAGSGSVDLAHIDQLHMAHYVGALPAGLPVALRQQNIESVLMRRYAEKAANPLVRSYASLQAKRLRRYEAVTTMRFDLCTVMTEVDAAALREMAPHACIETVSAGVDTEYFHPDVLKITPEPLRLVTTGDYRWPPTADGLTYFVKNVYPLIHQAVPDVRLAVVGHEPPETVRRAAESAGICVTGRVEDIRMEILRAAVCVVPTRIGSGIRLKILEAMALSRPVVSTRIGCEGIEAVPGVHLLVADTPEDFATQVVRLLENPSEGRRIADAALRIVRERYAWPVLTDRLSALYERMLRERG